MKINNFTHDQIKFQQYGNELWEMAKYLDEKEYLVYVKGEEKDYEYTFTGKELKNKKCPLRYVEDADGSSSVCGGHLKEIENGFECEACGQHFIDTK